MSEIAENELNFKSLNFGELKNALSKTKKGKFNGGTWMHPILFIKFAMYLNPSFEYHVLKFVRDEMIKFRNMAGDNYKKLTSSINSIKGTQEDYSKVAKALNYIVFNAHSKDIRNKATEEQLQELHKLEDNLSFLIDMGYIKDIDSLISKMRDIWYKKYSSPF